VTQNGSDAVLFCFEVNDSSCRPRLPSVAGATFVSRGVHAELHIPHMLPQVPRFRLGSVFVRLDLLRRLNDEGHSSASFLREEQPMKLAARRTRSLKRGFTLIETALATVIVGTGVLSIVAAQQAFHTQNSWSTHSTIAARLGNEIREMTLQLPRHDPVTGQAFWGIESNESDVEQFDDLDDFDGDDSGLVFSAALGNGPLNARRERILDMEGWSQTVLVQNVDPYDITSVVPNNSTPMLKVTVIVEFQGPYDDEPVEMTRVSWVAPQ
jgi:hypothetical protein